MTLIAAIKRVVKKYTPPALLNWLIDVYCLFFLDSKKYTIRKLDRFFEISDKNNCIRVDLTHNVYIPDVVNSFNYYFASVTPIEYRDLNIVDYSLPRFHEVPGY